MAAASLWGAMAGIRFHALDSSSGVRVSDEVGNERTELRFGRSTEWTPTPTDEFPFPVSGAIETTVPGLELAPFSPVYLRDSTGQALLSVAPGDEHELPEHEYCLELCTPVKTYVLFRGGGVVRACEERTEVAFDGLTSVRIGGRSPRTRPQATITAPRDPAAVMTALSCLGSGIRTTSPSRSYSTTRGYPPLVEIGSALSIPEGIRSNDSRVTLGVPPRFEFVFPAASLTYYLDASLEPAPTPHVRIDGDVVRELSEERYQGAVEELLQQVFFLDCLTRTVGHYPFETHSYRRLVDDLPFDVGDLYDADLGTRVRSYLSVPFELIESELPTWSVTAHVEPKAEHVQYLPHLAYQLAFVRTGEFDRLSGPSARQKGLETFMAYHDGGTTRIAEEVFDASASFVDLSPATNTDVDVWVGEDIPLHANELLLEGFENRLHREPVAESTITVNIVCNELWMDGEAAASVERYDDRVDLPFDVEVHHHLDGDEMREVLEADVDFLHYIGHANTDGLKCRDGYLDVRSVPGIGADMFFLNACQSYRPGVDMVRNGCIGGIVTLSEVTDDEATTVGRTVARLLNLGFPLRNALLIARRRSIVGGQYLAIGDDSASMVQGESGAPYECSVTNRGDAYELTVRTYPTNRYHLGSLFRPNLEGDVEQYLVGKPIGPVELSREELVAFLELENAPVTFDGEFRWAFDLAAELG